MKNNDRRRILTRTVAQPLLTETLTKVGGGFDPNAEWPEVTEIYTMTGGDYDACDVDPR
jgi:hypothetical protein